MHAPSPSLRRLLAVALGVALLALAASGWLIELKLTAQLDAAARTRMAVPLLSVRDALQGPLAQGLPLASGAALDELLAREAGADAAIVSLAVLDGEGRPVAQVGGGGADHALSQALSSAFGQRVGEVRVGYRLDAERAAVAQWRGELLRAAGVALGLAAALLPLGGRWLRQRPGRAGRAGLLLSAWLVLLLAGFALAGLQAAQQGLRAPLERKALVVGMSLQALIGKAQGLGLTPTELVGVDAQLDALRAEHPELGHLALVDAAGRRLAASGAPEPGLQLPLAGGGHIEVAVSAGFVRAALREAWLDLAVVVVVVAFLARELLRAGLPAAGRDALSLQRLRAPLLLFILAEELTRAFLPGFAQGLGGRGAQAAALAGLPIVVFMAVVALAQAPLAVWAERVGLRRAFGLGGLLAALALAGAAMAPSLPAFIGWRALGGLGWALVFVAAQGVVLAHSSAAERPRAFADFVSAILVAGVCGPPLGGLLVDQLGARAGFAVAALLALLALLCLAGLPAQPPRGAGAAAAAAPPRARLLREPGFRAITLFAALPAKLILAGLCFYLLPLHLQAAGAPAASVGRGQMLYALALLALLPLAARLAADGGEAMQRRLVGGGLCLSALGALGLGAALLSEAVPPAEASAYVALALLGVGQGLAIAAQSSLLASWCAPAIAQWGSGAVFGVYRLLERLGNALGPLLAGVLLLAAGVGAAMSLLGALVMLSGLLFLWRTRRLAS